ADAPAQPPPPRLPDVDRHAQRASLAAVAMDTGLADELPPRARRAPAMARCDAKACKLRIAERAEPVDLVLHPLPRLVEVGMDAARPRQARARPPRRPQRAGQPRAGRSGRRRVRRPTRPP